LTQGLLVLQGVFFKKIFIKKKFLLIFVFLTYGLSFASLLFFFYHSEMSFIVVGLGNPGEDYAKTRHNVGWIVLDKFLKEFNFSDFAENAKNKGAIAIGKVGKEKVTVLKPLTMMNASGKAVATLIKSKKQAQNLVVIHDDLDMAIGNYKLVYNRGSGGHKGVESIKRAIGTNEFLRIKIGVAPATPSGKIKKPKGEKAVLDFIIGEFKKPELEKIQKVMKDISLALESVILDGRALAMNDWN